MRARRLLLVGSYVSLIYYSCISHILHTRSLQTTHSVHTSHPTRTPHTAHTAQRTHTRVTTHIRESREYTRFYCERSAGPARSASGERGRGSGEGGVHLCSGALAVAVGDSRAIAYPRPARPRPPPRGRGARHVLRYMVQHTHTISRLDLDLGQERRNAHPPPLTAPMAPLTACDVAIDAACAAASETTSAVAAAASPPPASPPSWRSSSSQQMSRQPKGSAALKAACCSHGSDDVFNGMASKPWGQSLSSPNELPSTLPAEEETSSGRNANSCVRPRAGSDEIGGSTHRMERRAHLCVAELGRKATPGRTTRVGAREALREGHIEKGSRLHLLVLRGAVVKALLRLKAGRAREVRRAANVATAAFFNEDVAIGTGPISKAVRYRIAVGGLGGAAVQIRPLLAHRNKPLPARGPRVGEVALVAFVALVKYVHHDRLLHCGGDDCADCFADQRRHNHRADRLDDLPVLAAAQVAGDGEEDGSGHSGDDERKPFATPWVPNASKGDQPGEKRERAKGRRRGKHAVC